MTRSKYEAQGLLYFSTWNRYGNRYWPAMYLIDKRGIIRYVRIGEGGYAETERQIQALLAEG